MSRSSVVSALAIYPQLPDRSQHGCNPGRVVEVPERQLSCVSVGAGVVVHVVVPGRRGFTV